MTRIVLAQLARLALCVSVILAAACGAGPNDVSGPTPQPTPGDSSSPAPGPSPSPSPGGASCTTPGVTGQPPTIGEAGGHYMLSIAAPSGCAWTASVDAPWAEIGPVAGQGNGEVELRITRNPVRDARTVTVTVNSQSLRIVQEPAGCVYTVDRTALDVSWNTDPVSVRLTTTVSSCVWTVSTTDSWIHPRMSSGAGSTTIVLDIDRHTSDNPRRGSVTIAGHVVSVVQQRN
jgi:hypothetical protein